MNSDNILFEQYKLYIQNKESFIDRSFNTNKFYMILVLTLVLIIFLTKDYTLAYGLTSTLIFSAAGMAICILWWLNIDAYNLLIKVKLAKVIEEIEKSLPCQPYATEFAALNDLKKNKKEFLFSDIQKCLAVIVLILFFVLFANEFVLLFLV